MRLAKLIAQRGIASRRKAEELIAEGRVTVNGEMALITTPVDPEADVVEINGQRLPKEPAKAYYLLNKPGGYITGRGDTRGRQTVLDLVKELPVRVEPVGRLDYDTEGALLLTNDGEMAFGLTHPSRGVEKVYRARVEGRPMAEDMAAIERGIPLEDGVTKPAKARIVSRGDKSSVVEITVTEGRNRMIRRMMSYLGHHVMDLTRMSFGGISIEGLKLGKVRRLNEREVAALSKQAARRASRDRAKTAGAGADKRPDSNKQSRKHANRGDKLTNRQTDKLAGRPAAKSVTRGRAKKPRVRQDRQSE
ncbi:MAG TPA: pseudouridine synthase [Dehalococcoidia bacterium]|nr:pseudouridine synthase [Dehalococcoidia bacterium]